MNSTYRKTQTDDADEGNGQIINQFYEVVF